MRRLLFIWILFIFWIFPFFCLANSTGGLFEQPPETSFSGWQTQFPYQRNIEWDFSSNPNGENGDQSTPTNPGPSPGAVYYGTQDKPLFESDYIKFENASWNEGLGAIGVDNSAGNELITGQVTFHLDNLDNPNLFKHLYFEVGFDEYNNPPAGSGSTSIDVYSSGGASVSSITGGYTTSGLLFNGWEITPNPEYEEIIFTWNVDPGAEKYITNFHVATECVVPIPASVLLLGSGIVGLAAFMRKQRKEA